MAVSNKNILITPATNVADPAVPKIVFSGADASTANQDITLNVYPQNGGTLSFEGSNGQLFSINNSVTGTIYSVNDVSGIPSIEVQDSGLIKLAQYSGNVVLGSAVDDGKKFQVTGTSSFTGDSLYKVSARTIYGPNTTWASYLYVGGDGTNGITRTANIASIVTTNGNMHIDSGTDKSMYLNFYSGTGGIQFGNGAQGVVATINAAGVFSGNGSGLTNLVGGNVSGAVGSATNFNNGNAYSNAGQVYVDTLESVSAGDWLELCYTNGAGVRIGAGGANGNKPLYAAGLYDNGNRVYSAANPQTNATDTTKLPTAGGTMTGRISGSIGATTGGFGFDSDTGMTSTGDGNLKFYTNNVYAGGPVTGTQNWDINITGTASSATDSTKLPTAGGAMSGTLTAKRIEWTGSGGDSGVSFGVSHYAMGQASGTWTHPYPDLIIGYHTGIRMGAYPGYGGMRFYNNSPTSDGSAAEAELFSIGNGDNHVRVANNLYVAGSEQNNSLGVGTTASGTAGEIRATYNITAYYSDDRLKTRTGNIENALDKISTLDTFYYHANETAQALGYKPVPEVGISAQQVQAIMPQVVAPAPIDDQYLTVRYEKLVPLLIAAIKEQQAIIDSQEQRLARLEALINKP